MARAKKLWVHVGGGCSLGGGRLPCDDTYEHSTTGKRVELRTTKEQHFKMPTRVANMARFKAALKRSR